MFRDSPLEICSLAVVKFSLNKTVDTPKFTAIPPHVMILSEMEAMNIKMQALQGNIFGDLEKAMDERGFCTQEYNIQSIIKAMEEQSKKLLADVLATTTATPINMTTETRQEMNYLNFVEEDGYKLDEIAESNEEKRDKQQRELQISIANVKRRKFTIGMHHGRLNPLPADFKFPSQTLQQLVVNYLLGDSAKNSPPYSLFSPDYFRHCKSDLKSLSMMKKLMNHVKKLHCSKDFGTTKVRIGLMNVVLIYGMR